VRKLRLLIVTAVAVLGIAAVALAQSTNNITFTATTSAHGGKTAKPAPTSLTFKYANVDPAGKQLPPVKTFKLFVDNAKINPGLLATCTAAKMNLAQTDTGCPAASKIGTGTINSIAGTPGNPATSSIACGGKLTVYNGGAGHAALWITLAPPACPLTQQEGIDVKLGKKAHGLTMTFSVPDGLIKIQGLDVSVLNFSTTIKKITKTNKQHKKQGYIESVCNKSKKRAYGITATDTVGGTQSSTGSGTC
jgi:hypothetical protein